MNWTQCQRWKGFSIRMARRGWPDITLARRKKIENRIIDFFDCRILAGGNEKNGTWRKIHDWDSGDDSEYVCDHVSDFFDDILGNKPGLDGAYTTKFLNQITCCIRAGIDCAVLPSGGVLGFNVGDLKRMYPKGIPEWILSEYEGLENGKDNEGIWL